MAGDAVNIKVFNPLKLCSGLTGKKPANCHYSYNLPLAPIKRTKDDTNSSKLETIQLLAEEKSITIQNMALIT